MPEIDSQNTDNQERDLHLSPNQQKRAGHSLRSAGSILHNIGYGKGGHNDDNTGYGQGGYNDPTIKASENLTKAKRLGNAAGTGMQATGTGMKAAGKGMQAAGKGVEYAGKGIQAAGTAIQAGGQAMASAGAALSSTGIGAIAGVPLSLLGAGTTAAGAGTKFAGMGIGATGRGLNTVGKGIDKAGSGMNNLGKNVRNASKNLPSSNNQSNNLVNQMGKAGTKALPGGSLPISPMPKQNDMTKSMMDKSPINSPAGAFGNKTDEGKEEKTNEMGGASPGAQSPIKAITFISNSLGNVIRKLLPFTPIYESMDKSMGRASTNRLLISCTGSCCSASLYLLFFVLIFSILASIAAAIFG